MRKIIVLLAMLVLLLSQAYACITFGTVIKDVKVTERIEPYETDEGIRVSVISGSISFTPMENIVTLGLIDFKQIVPRELRSLKEGGIIDLDEESIEDIGALAENHKTIYKKPWIKLWKIELFKRWGSEGNCNAPIILFGNEFFEYCTKC